MDGSGPAPHRTRTMIPPDSYRRERAAAVLRWCGTRPRSRSTLDRSPKANGAVLARGTGTAAGCLSSLLVQERLRLRRQGIGLVPVAGLGRNAAVLVDAAGPEEPGAVRSAVSGATRGRTDRDVRARPRRCCRWPTCRRWTDSGSTATCQVLAEYAREVVGSRFEGNAVPDAKLFISVLRLMPWLCTYWPVMIEPRDGQRRGA